MIVNGSKFLKKTDYNLQGSKALGPRSSPTITCMTSGMSIFSALWFHPGTEKANCLGSSCLAVFNQQIHREKKCVGFLGDGQFVTFLIWISLRMAQTAEF